MSSLTPVERRGLAILLSPRRVGIARVDERIERGLPFEPMPHPAPIQIVRVHDSDGRHAAYRSALRALCGCRIKRALRGRSGQAAPPTCEACAAALAEHRALGLVRDRAECCPASTKSGRPCRRIPGPSGYCPSHKRLAA